MPRIKLNTFFNYRLPNKKKWLLTDDFLITFKEELDRIFKIKEEYQTYWDSYAWLEGTGGFYKALKIASDKHNVRKAIYEYVLKLPWYQSDLFDEELTILMYKRGIIKEGNIENVNSDYTNEDLNKLERNGEIEWVEDVKYYKDYHVTKRVWQFVDNTK